MKKGVVVAKSAEISRAPSTLQASGSYIVMAGNHPHVIGKAQWSTLPPGILKTLVGGA